MPFNIVGNTGHVGSFWWTVCVCGPSILSFHLRVLVPQRTIHTWWLIPLSKWVITPVINGISRVNPLITGVITHLLSGMSHQVLLFCFLLWKSGDSGLFEKKQDRTTHGQ